MNFFKNVLSHFKHNTCGDISSTAHTSSPDDLSNILDNISEEYSENYAENSQVNDIDQTLHEIDCFTVDNMTSDESQTIDDEDSQNSELKMQAGSPIIDLDNLSVSGMIENLIGKDNHQEMDSVSSNEMPLNAANDNIINNCFETCDLETNVKTTKNITKDIIKPETEYYPSSQNLFHSIDATDIEDQIKYFAIRTCNDTKKGPNSQSQSSNTQDITSILVRGHEITFGTKVVAELVAINPVITNTQNAENTCKKDLNQNIVKKEELDTTNIDDSVMRVFSVDDCKSLNEEKDLVISISTPDDCNEKSDSDGYHSSDFEFISESEAMANGLYVVNERRSKAKTKTTRTKKTAAVPYTSCPTPTTSTETLSTINNNLAVSRDYRSMHRQFLAKEADRHRENHVMPQGQDFLNLFHGPNAPEAYDYILEHKSVRAQSCMSTRYEGIGFDMRLMVRQEQVNDEDKRDAEECAKKIIDMYAELNRKKRRRM